MHVAGVLALIYTRVSRGEQARDGVALDVQLAVCRRYAAQHSWLLGNEYQDVPTGARDDRLQSQALLAEVRRLRTNSQARADLAAAAAELEHLGRAQPRTALPPVAEVLCAAGPWATGLATANVPAQREVLSSLIARAV